MTLTQVLAGSSGAIVLLAGATLAMLPRHVTVERTAHVHAAPEKVLALAASNTGYQQFNPYLTADPKLAIEHFGPETGVGSGFRFEGQEGRGTQVVSAISANQVSYAIDLGPMGQPEQTIRAEPTADGTLVTWTMQSDLGLNPIARVFGLFLDDMIGKAFDQGLNNLDNALSGA